MIKCGRPWPLLATGMILTIAAGAAHAITWNGDDPDRGIVSSQGLTDRAGPYQNVHTVRNETNGARGTGTLLNGWWVITARHCVQLGPDYGRIAPPEKIYFDISGRRYYATAIFVGRWSDEIALIRLAEEVPDVMTIELYDGQDEPSRIVSFGGYGHYGIIGGETRGDVRFHRAYNVPWVDPTGKLRVKADGKPRLKELGLLEGIVQAGDSGGPLFVLDADDEHWQDWNRYRLAGVVAQGGGNHWGSESIFARVSSHYEWAKQIMSENPPSTVAITEPGM